MGCAKADQRRCCKGLGVDLVVAAVHEAYSQSSGHTIVDRLAWLSRQLNSAARARAQSRYVDLSTPQRATAALPTVALGILRAHCTAPPQALRGWNRNQMGSPQQHRQPDSALQDVARMFSLSLGWRSMHLMRIRRTSGTRCGKATACARSIFALHHMRVRRTCAAAAQRCCAAVTAQRRCAAVTAPSRT